MTIFLTLYSFSFFLHVIVVFLSFAFAAHAITSTTKSHAAKDYQSAATATNKPMQTDEVEQE